MGAPKPTLGYQSRTEAVLALRGQRLSTREIASRIGIEEKTVCALELSAGRSRRPRRRHEEICRTVLFPVEILDSLAPHAARRNMHVNRLARLIVEQAVDDDMVDAILDDADAREEWS